jgi:hypothetical protein
LKAGALTLINVKASLIIAGGCQEIHCCGYRRNNRFAVSRQVNITVWKLKRIQMIEIMLDEMKEAKNYFRASLFLNKKQRHKKLNH